MAQIAIFLLWIWREQILWAESSEFIADEYDRERLVK